MKNGEIVWQNKTITFVAAVITKKNFFVEIKVPFGCTHYITDVKTIQEFSISCHSVSESRIQSYLLLLFVLYENYTLFRFLVSVYTKGEMAGDKLYCQQGQG